MASQAAKRKREQARGYCGKVILAPGAAGEIIHVPRGANLKHLIVVVQALRPLGTAERSIVGPGQAEVEITVHPYRLASFSECNR